MPCTVMYPIKILKTIPSVHSDKDLVVLVSLSSFMLLLKFPTIPNTTVAINRGITIILIIFIIIVVITVITG